MNATKLRIQFVPGNKIESEVCSKQHKWKYYRFGTRGGTSTEDIKDLQLLESSWTVVAEPLTLVRHQAHFLFVELWNKPPVVSVLWSTQTNRPYSKSRHNSNKLHKAKKKDKHTFTKLHPLKESAEKDMWIKQGPLCNWICNCVNSDARKVCGMFESLSLQFLSPLSCFLEPRMQKKVDLVFVHWNSKTIRFSLSVTVLSRMQMHGNWNKHTWK